MKKPAKLHAAILAALASSSYADDTCLPPDAGSKSPLEVFQCFEAKLSGQQLQMGELAAANQNQLLRIAELEKANQKLRRAMQTHSLTVEQPNEILASKLPSAKFSVRQISGEPEYGHPDINYAIEINDRSGGSSAGAALKFSTANGTGANIYFQAHGANEGGGLYFQTSPDYKGLATRMAILRNGNVQVNGNVKATAFKTGDIFFEKDGKTLWQMFEDEHGLYVNHLKTGHTYRFVLEKIQ